MLAIRRKIPQNGWTPRRKTSNLPGEDYYGGRISGDGGGGTIHCGRIIYSKLKIIGFFFSEKYKIQQIHTVISRNNDELNNV